MILNEALKNVNIIVRATRMTADEHDALKESVNLIVTHIKDLEEKVKILEIEKDVKDKV